MERLLTARRQIELESEHWDQHRWIDVDYHSDEYRRELEKPVDSRSVCGSAYCLAGWAAVLAGDRFIDTGAVFVPGAGVVLDVEDRANELFGINWADGEDLYAGENTLEDIDRKILELTGRVA